MCREFSCTLHPVSIDGTIFKPWTQKQKMGPNLSKHLPEWGWISCHFASFAGSRDWGFESWCSGWSPASGPCNLCPHAERPIGRSSKVFGTSGRSPQGTQTALPGSRSWRLPTPAPVPPNLSHSSPRRTFQFCRLKLLSDSCIQITCPHSLSFCSSNWNSLPFPSLNSYFIYFSNLELNEPIKKKKMLVKYSRVESRAPLRNRKDFICFPLFSPVNLTEFIHI